MNIERIKHDLTQGSADWHQFRSTHFGASEAAAMLGLSKYTTRAGLLRAKATGAEKEISASLQAVFDRGHETEALARPLAEDIVGNFLYPLTYSYGKLSASCDGLTKSGGIAFEHKQYNADLHASVMRSELPEEHQPQCQQVMLVTGATKLLFVCSDGTRDNFAGMWVHADLSWMARIEAGWLQFEADLAAYAPAEAVVVPIAAPIRDLPAIRYQLNGLSLTSNLSEFREAALVLVEDSKRELTTDQDFADTDARNKAFKVAEDKIDLMCGQVLAEIEDVDKFTRDLKAVSDLIRQARLNGEKKVSMRKDAIRLDIISDGRTAFGEHIARLNKRIGKEYMPTVPVDFAGAVKGKRTIASLHDAVDTELARAKIAANEIADRISVNLSSLREHAADYTALFPDTAQIVLKSNDDLVSLIKVRITDYQAAEAKKAEAARVAAVAKAAQDEAARLTKEKADAIAFDARVVASALPIPQAVAAPAFVTRSTVYIAPAIKQADDIIAAINEILIELTRAEQIEILNVAIAIENRPMRQSSKAA